MTRSRRLLLPGETPRAKGGWLVVVVVMVICVTAVGLLAMNVAR